MADDQNQKGQQRHAEGAHGDKTHRAVIDNLRQRQARDDGAGDVAAEGSPYGTNPVDGHHRLSEDREQHDEAEKNSELKKTRGSDPAR
jgi:hypothetical protein